MREIKFRAYHKREKRFYYFDLETVTKTHYVGYYHPITGEHDCELDNTNLYSEKQLYTGLKDKNGKEVYEGDILGIDEGNRLVEVNWFQPQACFDTRPIKILNESMPFAKLRESDYGWRTEVIGNIYENKELLNEEVAIEHKK